MTASDSPELDPGLRPVNASTVCSRLPVLNTPEARSLAWFLQSLSHEPGGLARVARELVAMFPARMQTARMAQIGTPRGGHYSAADARDILTELDVIAPWRWLGGCSEETIHDEPEPPMEERAVAYPRSLCFEAAKANLPTVLRHFCCASEWQQLTGGGVPWFQDLHGALLEYQGQHNASARESFYLTNIGRAVWRTLDRCLLERDGGVIEGQTGRGKSAAVKA